MAIPKIKATYSLDVATIRALERLAELWSVSKSEVVRRAIRRAARSNEPVNDALAALDELQQLLSDSGTSPEDWAEEVRQERTDSEESRRGSYTP